MTVVSRVLCGCSAGTIAVWDLYAALHGAPPVREADTQPATTPSANGHKPALTNGNAAGGGGASLRTLGKEEVVAVPPGMPLLREPSSRRAGVPSVSLARTFATKRTPVHVVAFSHRNLLLAAGPYMQAPPPVVPDA